MRSKLLPVLACTILSMTMVLAQTRAGGGSDRGSGGAPTRSDGGDRYRSESAPTPSAPASNYSSAGGVGRQSTFSSPPQPAYHGRSGGYYGDYWNSTQAFYYDMLRTYRFIPVGYYTFRYSVGDSTVDQSLIRLALRDSIESAHFLVSYSEELSGLLDQYQSGSMERDDFSDRFKSTLNAIQKLAKTIRKDSRLGYLDQRKGVEMAEPPHATSITGLRDLVDELKQQALTIESGLQTHYEEDMSRVIDLRTLKQPSFKTLSSRIEQLSKTIMDSSKRI